jgi:hypothetical protein
MIQLNYVLEKNAQMKSLHAKRTHSVPSPPQSAPTNVLQITHAWLLVQTNQATNYSLP